LQDLGIAASAAHIKREASMANQKNILIVEDDQLISMSVVDDLADIGNPIAVATEGEALDVLGQSEIAFAIVDYHLREGTSQRIIDVLRERGIPFVICTGSVPEVEGGSLDGLPQMPKPYLTNDLRQVVTAAL
jgi:CheY-like chemotaxis protein